MIDHFCQSCGSPLARCEDSCGCANALINALRAELAAAKEKFCEARIFTERIAQRLGDSGFDRNADNIHEFLDKALRQRDEMAAALEACGEHVYREMLTQVREEGHNERSGIGDWTLTLAERTRQYIQNYLAKVAPYAILAARDEAKDATIARMAEALRETRAKALRYLAEPALSETGTLIGIAENVDAALAATDAGEWLERQRREAAAAELKRMAGHVYREYSIQAGNFLAARAAELEGGRG